MKDDMFSEELLVNYLLGELPEERQIEIEDRAFSDRQFLQKILAIESDLIDEYVRGELSDSQRRLFESRFLLSVERRRKVEFAKALAGVLSDTAVVEKESLPAVARTPVGLWDSLIAFLRRLSPAASFLLTAAALLFVIGSSWLVIESLRLRAHVGQLQAEQQLRQRDRQALEEQLADERTRNDSLSSRLESEQQERERREEVIRELERERAEPANNPVQPAILSLVLLPGTSRGGGSRPKLVLSPPARLVRLQIGIEPGEEYKKFRVEIRSQAGQTVWSQDNLAARTGRTGRAVVVTLPARLLGASQYELGLKGITDSGKTEDVAYYYFDVLKK